MIQQDRNRYEASREEAQRQLRNCHVDDEVYYTNLVNAYHDVFKALETLDLLIYKNNFYKNEHGVLIDKRGE
jgi:hypothetical protein